LIPDQCNATKKECLVLGMKVWNKTVVSTRKMRAAEIDTFWHDRPN